MMDITTLQHDLFLAIGGIVGVATALRTLATALRGLARWTATKRDDEFLHYAIDGLGWVVRTLNHFSAGADSYRRKS